jgi:hypothetical protein
MMQVKKPVLILKAGRNRFDSVTSNTSNSFSYLDNVKVYNVTPFVVVIG